MRISFEGKLGIWLTVIGLAGAGALVVAPAPIGTTIGWTLIIVAAIGTVFLACYHICGWLGLEWKIGQKRRMITLTGMVACGFGFIVFAAAHLWSIRSAEIAMSKPAPQTDAPKTSNTDELAALAELKAQLTDKIREADALRSELNSVETQQITSAPVPQPPMSIPIVPKTQWGPTAASDIPIKHQIIDAVIPIIDRQAKLLQSLHDRAYEMTKSTPVNIRNALQNQKNWIMENAKPLYEIRNSNERFDDLFKILDQSFMPQLTAALDECKALAEDIIDIPEGDLNAVVPRMIRVFTPCRQKYALALTEAISWQTTTKSALLNRRRELQ